jgi:ABC-type multidrug transport system ATPase subunit
MGDVARAADKVFVMDKGRIVMEGPPQEVFSKGDVLTAKGLGLPPAAEMAGMMKERGVDLGCVPLTIEAAVDAIDSFLAGRGGA